VAVAAGTGTAAVAAGVATAAAVTVAVGTVAVGVEQFPDPPAGTPPTDTSPREPRKRCGSCVCYGKGKGPFPLESYRKNEGGGYEEYTPATCEQDCAFHKYSGFKCSGDKTVTWFN